MGCLQKSLANLFSVPWPGPGIAMTKDRKAMESGPVLGWQGQESWDVKYTTVRSRAHSVPF